MRRAVIVVGCLLFLSTPLLSEGLEAAPNPVPHCTLVISEHSVEVPVHPYSPSNVILHGNVSVERTQCIERAIVRISTSIDAGWPVRTVPSSIPFINPTTQRFTIEVTVPPGAPPLAATLSVVSTTHRPGHPPITVNTTCTIVPIPWSSVTLEVVRSPLVTGEDGSTRVPVRVWNTGTSEDTYQLELRRDGVLLTGWGGPDRVTVPPRGSAEVNVTLPNRGTPRETQVIGYTIEACRVTVGADRPASGVNSASSRRVPLVVVDGRTDGERIADALLSFMWPVLALEMTLSVLLFLQRRRVGGTGVGDDKDYL